MATAAETTRAHAAYLTLTYAASSAQERLFELQSTLLSSPVNGTTTRMHASARPQIITHDRSRTARGEPIPPVALTREQCLEFAVGSIARVLGPRFAEADGFPTRVRLPDEPLMLVDRIVSIEGEPASMTHGRVVTEHDIYAGAWYLDGGSIPTCIAVEAGQADLFLSGYLGVDLATRGLACYRLLDAVVTFHRGLPGPGDVIHYDIEIERFARQGDTIIFFFNFEGTVDGQPLLSMRKGCAGFFTQVQLAQGRGIVHTALDRMAQPGVRPADWRDLVPVARESYTDAQVERLRHGDLAGCYGPAFGGLELSRAIRLPSGRMKLVDRVLELDPQGGRFGIGFIRAEADIHPDDWFITCHFVDDMVMPGTLMYECCMHTLRILLMRMGWVGEQGAVACEPVPGVASQLKCRGQVLAQTRRVTYEITLKEVGYSPEPFALADALMYSDGHPIVEIRNMSCQYRGTDRATLELLWMASETSPVVPRGRNKNRGEAAPLEHSAPAASAPSRASATRSLVHDREQILQYAIGMPSQAFGEPYRVFDHERVLARLPGPPYLYMDRVLEVRDGEPFVLRAGATAVAEYDVPPAAWYFDANRQASMSFAVLLEAVLQPCGWLACYLGSALRGGAQDLSFRNLGGQATLYQETFPDAGALVMTVKLTKTSESGGMIIQEYDLMVTCAGERVYQGTTSFGFFSKQALAEQVGVRGAQLHQPSDAEMERAREPLRSTAPGLALPDTTFKMFDGVEVFVPDGGPAGLGYIRGTKRVEPQEWFFKAHFYQDPVCPGSLGLESFIQLLKVVARDRWGQTGDLLRFEPMALGVPHSWIYRGQVVPTNRRVTVEASITWIDDATRTLTADGYLAVDGLPIYQMTGFSMRVVPAAPELTRGS